MSSDSIAAYDLPERVSRYDADMEIMHPKRTKMVEIGLEVLPYGAHAPLAAVDLGVGTGYFTKCFLQEFPSSRVVAIDGAESMIELARSRLGPLINRVAFVVGDFRELGRLVEHIGPIDVVFSSYALHHLNADEKSGVIRQAVERLRSGGWFINADLVVSGDRVVEERIQKLRVEGIVSRTQGNDPRFRDEVATRAFLDQLEANEGDQPITLSEDLEIAWRAGLEHVEMFWKEYREAVYGGPK